ncbi:hypothetical protein GPJ56_008116 [Histomonas meleagridis]|uniref:uncharacterized protein n=1 Tax=Histomonas meleagridis TaxID=135588 RepID=UPI00355A40BB|nr:hypothetical protein GPJ56_008116 [Histomonas meleagridis]KAH0802043.1 hypothetical protein GO595_005124 [Histomonas meleagridis]
MHQTPRLANNLLKNPELPEAFIDALNSGFPEDLNILIMKTIIVIFPHSPEVQDIYIDSGLCMCLFDFLSSQSLPLLEASIALVDTISESSGYGRDSVLCLGLHTFIIEIAKSEINEQITVQACESLSKIFSNKQHIDSNTLTSCVEPIAELLSLHSVHAVYIILACFISMTNKLPALVFNMYDLNLFPVIVNFLHNPELIGMALPLIGNLSVGQSFHIKTLLDCGLFPLLMQLIQTEFTADVYWVLSNILESVPQMTIGLFNPNFVAQTVEIAMTSSFEVKKEAAFFIATLMLFTQNADLKYFKNEDVVDLMIEMLGCSSNLIVLRCLDALLRFVHVNSTTGDEEFLSLLQTKDLYNPLNNLIERGSHMIKERAEFLLCNLDATKSVI